MKLVRAQPVRQSPILGPLDGAHSAEPFRGSAQAIPVVIDQRVLRGEPIFAFLTRWRLLVAAEYLLTTSRPIESSGD